MTTTTDVQIVEAPLSADERGDLARHEQTITRGQQTFIEVGLALADIQRRRLYRESHPSLEAYLAERYPDITRRRAYQLIGGAETALALTDGDVNPGTQPLPAPTSERQVRPLAGLPPEQQKQVYAAATDAAGGRAPTARQVEAAARTVKATPPTSTPAPAPAPAPAVTLTPLTPASPPPLPLAGGEAVEVIATAGPDLTALKTAEALVALLEQALTLAETARDAARHDAGGARVVFDDAAVEQAARVFVASPAARGAAAMLAFAGRQVDG